ncbi:MAG: asparagine synthetase B family protein [Planctomycetota bacterium]
MPGICLLIDRSPDVEIEARLESMLRSMQHHHWYRSTRHSDAAAGVGLGLCCRRPSELATQAFVSRDGRVSTIMAGELYDSDVQRRALREIGRPLETESQAEVLAQGYFAQGPAFFAGLRGKFSAAIWDAARKQLVVVGDRFGMAPLYYARVPGRLLVASEIKALLSDPDVSREASFRGLAQFFTYGQYLGEDTSLEAVRLVPAAGCLTYDVERDELSVSRYWELPVSGQAEQSEDALLDRADRAFKQAVDRCLGGNANLGLSLSGGLDARTILGVIDHDKVALTTVAMGIEGCADHRSASQLAALTNRRHHNYVLTTEFLNDFGTHLANMVRLTDGQYLSQCIVMPTLPFYRDLGIDVLLRGHAGELFHMNKAYNYSLGRAALDMRNVAELEQWAFSRLRAYMLDGVDGPLFASHSRTAMDHEAEESLRQCLKQSEGADPPAHRVWHLFLTQRLRRETALSLVKFGSVVETRLPYVDQDLIDVVMGMPPRLKLGETIQAEILQRRRPEFLGVVNVNTGTRMGAGRFAQRIAGFRQKVYAKLGVRGYQPYERLGLWLRRELKPLVEETLLSDRCLGRGLFHPDTTRSIVARHSANERNHTFLIMAMMTCELAQRQFVDGDGLPAPAESSLAVTR